MLPLALRYSKYAIGAAFVGVLMWALLWTVVGLVNEPPQPTAEHEFHLHPGQKAGGGEQEIAFASDGPFGRFDTAQLQRGFQVYKEVCASCHSLSLVSFRVLAGLGYNEAQIKRIAADWAAKQPTFDPKTGVRDERTNLPSDHIPQVFYAGNGSPPDLSLIAKARHGGGAYIYSLLTGYQTTQPRELLEHFPGSKTPAGMYYNPYFANLNIAMPPPLTSDGQVTYLDGTPSTVDQMAKDVSAFLIWTAEPQAQTRKRAGLAVVLFLLVTTLLAFGAYRTVWAGVKH